MRIRIAFLVAVLPLSFELMRASGCFGGSPDITPRNASPSVPSNGRITIARRSPTSVSWVGPDQRPIAFQQRQIGSGPSAARILIPSSTLQAGVHSIRTTGPDAVQTFRVVAYEDSAPPTLTGPLRLEGFNSPEPSSECPDNIFIRASFPTPQDDRTGLNDLSYFVSIQPSGEKASPNQDITLPAESISRGAVSFRIGETGCGCIPRVTLRPGAEYRITLRAVDAAGHESATALSGTVTIPGAP